MRYAGPSLGDAALPIYRSGRPVVFDPAVKTQSLRPGPQAGAWESAGMMSIDIAPYLPFARVDLEATSGFL